MSQGRQIMSFSAVVSLGVGAMIGAGIFALLGQAGAIAGSAVWISFLIGGLIALLTGYSLGKLGARYPSAGGMVEYLIHGWGSSLFSGGMAVLMYLAGLLSLALVAKTFGSYGATLVPGAPGWLAPLLAVGVMVLFVAVNLRGSASVGRVELWIVLFKFAVLLTLAIGGLTVLKPSLLAPSTYPGTSSIAASVAVTFFAYAGFRVITNAAENVDHPERTIPRAITTAILLVMALYIVIALVVFGTLTPDAVIAAKDHALAEAARPVFGSVGVAAVAVTALVATASAINASLFSVTNVSYQMAKDGELPGAVPAPRAARAARDCSSADSSCPSPPSRSTSLRSRSSAPSASSWSTRPFTWATCVCLATREPTGGWWPSPRWPPSPSWLSPLSMPPGRRGRCRSSSQQWWPSRSAASGCCGLTTRRRLRTRVAH